MLDHPLLEVLPIAAYTTDADGRITFFNEAAVELWGHRPTVGSSQWCGSWRLYWPDGRPMPHDECPMAIALKQGREVLGLDAIAERPNGTRVVFTPFPVPLKDGEGRVTGGINLLIDVTKRKEAEMAAAQMAAIVSSSDDAIVSKTLDGIVTSWNGGAVRIFGYRPEEMIGSSIRKLIPPELQEEEDHILSRIRKGERIDHFDTVRVTKDGEHIDVSLTISPILDPDNKIIGASKIARDVRDRKRHEELQRLLFNELNHRVKNTLATIQSLASQSLRTSANPNEFVNSFNGRVTALARAHDLLVKQQMSGTSLKQLVHEQVALGAEEAGRVAFSGPDITLDARVSIQMALVLHELATNARKYGALSVPDGALTITWRIESGDASVLHLEWRESGVADVREPRSTGFGTTLIQRSLEANSGETSLHFKDDGLICKIRLPLPEKQDFNDLPLVANRERSASSVDEPGGLLKGKRLLVVEDEPLLAMELEAELQSLGFSVVGPALTIKDARRLIADEEVDAALLDVNLAGETSGELAERLQEKVVPFAFLTGYGREGLPSGFQDAEIIPKPVVQARLIAAITGLLNGAGSSERAAH